MKSWLAIIVFNLLLSSNAFAHSGLASHPETSNEVAHFAEHALMALPVVIGLWLLVWGAKRFIANRVALRQRG